MSVQNESTFEETTVKLVCPVCASSIKYEEVAIEYWKDGNKSVGHVDCVFFISQGETRQHPPLK